MLLNSNRPACKTEYYASHKGEHDHLDNQDNLEIIEAMDNIKLEQLDNNFIDAISGLREYYY